MHCYSSHLEDSVFLHFLTGILPEFQEIANILNIRLSLNRSKYFPRQEQSIAKDKEKESFLRKQYM